MEGGLHAGKLGEALSTLARLRTPVDRFFTDVMVMADDPPVRANRLALLARLRDTFLLVADFGMIGGDA